MTMDPGSAPVPVPMAPTWSADAAPTPDAQTGYQQVMASLSTALTAWAGIKNAATKY